MLSRDEVVDLYRLILDREPENEQVINEKRHAGSPLEIAVDMFASEEFRVRNQDRFGAVPQTVAAPARESFRRRVARGLMARLLKTSAGQSLKEIARNAGESGAKF